MKSLVMYTVLASALTCGISEFVAYKEMQKLDNQPIITVGYPALDNCKEDEECTLACAQAFKVGVIKSLDECEY